MLKSKHEMDASFDLLLLIFWLYLLSIIEIEIHPFFDLWVIFYEIKLAKRQHFCAHFNQIASLSIIIVFLMTQIKLEYISMMFLAGKQWWTRSFNIYVRNCKRERECKKWEDYAKKNCLYLEQQKIVAAIISFSINEFNFWLIWIRFDFIAWSIIYAILRIDYIYFIHFNRESRLRKNVSSNECPL